jgi:hypothetical protein
MYTDLRLATLKAVSFYLLHNVSTLNQCRKLSCGTVVCKHFASYQGYPNYRWDFIRYAKGLKLNLKGRRFDTIEEIQAESQRVLDIVTEKDFQEAFQK